MGYLNETTQEPVRPMRLPASESMKQVIVPPQKMLLSAFPCICPVTYYLLLSLSLKILFFLRCLEKNQKDGTRQSVLKSQLLSPKNSVTLASLFTSCPLASSLVKQIMKIKQLKCTERCWPRASTRSTSAIAVLHSDRPSLPSSSLEKPVRGGTMAVLPLSPGLGI